MSDSWIAQLAGEIKRSDKGAAEDYARAQHYAAQAVERGRGFFMDVVLCLEENVSALRRELQGDVTSADMAIQRVKADEVRITRERFPWVDARLTRTDDAVMLDYARGPGTQGDPAQDRSVRSFAFRVTPDEKLRIEDAFAEPARNYEAPEEFARKVMEILFKPDSAGSRLATNPA